ncbi:hypothetical protein [Streptomyces eurythermus]
MPKHVGAFRAQRIGVPSGGTHAGPVGVACAQAFGVPCGVLRPRPVAASRAQRAGVPSGITDKSFDHPFAVQIDGQGRAWVTNSHLSLEEIRQAGRPRNVGGSVTVIGRDFKPVTSITDTSLQAPIGFALDSKGNAWVAGFFSSAVTEIRPNGTVAGVHRLPKRVFPWSVAIDGQDRVWVAGFGDSSVTLLCGVNSAACPSGASAGTVLSPAQGFRNKAIQHLTAVQIDPSGNAWVADNWSKIVPPTGGVGLVELIGAAAPVCTPLTPVPARPSATTGACPK